MKKFALLFSMLLMCLISTGYKSISALTAPDYSGKWDLTFYDAAGNLYGKRTISISEDGSISDKAVLNIGTMIYLTEISAIISNNGKLKEGKLTDTDNLDMVGSFTGSFTEMEGTGNWKNYYGKSGTWKAERSQKKDARD